jgi:hypothetical protein
VKKSYPKYYKLITQHKTKPNKLPNFPEMDIERIDMFLHSLNEFKKSYKVTLAFSTCTNIVMQSSTSLGRILNYLGKDVELVMELFDDIIKFKITKIREMKSKNTNKESFTNENKVKVLFDHLLDIEVQVKKRKVRLNHDTLRRIAELSVWSKAFCSTLIIVYNKFYVQKVAARPTPMKFIKNPDSKASRKQLDSKTIRNLNTEFQNIKLKPRNLTQFVFIDENLQFSKIHNIDVIKFNKSSAGALMVNTVAKDIGSIIGPKLKKKEFINKNLTLFSFRDFNLIKFNKPIDEIQKFNTVKNDSGIPLSFKLMKKDFIDKVFGYPDLVPIINTRFNKSSSKIPQFKEICVDSGCPIYVKLVKKEFIDKNTENFNFKKVEVIKLNNLFSENLKFMESAKDKNISRSLKLVKKEFIHKNTKDFNFKNVEVIKLNNLFSENLKFMESAKDKNILRSLKLVKKELIDRKIINLCIRNVEDIKFNTAIPESTKFVKSCEDKSLLRSIKNIKRTFIDKNLKLLDNIDIINFNIPSQNTPIFNELDKDRGYPILKKMHIKGFLKDYINKLNKALLPLTISERKINKQYDLVHKISRIKEIIKNNNHNAKEAYDNEFTKLNKNRSEYQRELLNYEDKMKIFIKLAGYKNKLIAYLTRLDDQITTLKEASFSLINKKIKLHFKRKETSNMNKKLTSEGFRYITY